MAWTVTTDWGQWTEVPQVREGTTKNPQDLKRGRKKCDWLDPKSNNNKKKIRKKTKK